MCIKNVFVSLWNFVVDMKYLVHVSVGKLFDVDGIIYYMWWVRKTRLHVPHWGLGVVYWRPVYMRRLGWLMFPWISPPEWHVWWVRVSCHWVIVMRVRSRGPRSSRFRESLSDPFDRFWLGHASFFAVVNASDLPIGSTNVQASVSSSGSVRVVSVSVFTWFGIDYVLE